MIVRSAGQEKLERCSSIAWNSCPAAIQHNEEHPSVDHCPFLQESLVQYCSAVTMPLYIPFSETSLSRCGNGGHSYCEVFLSAYGSELQKTSGKRSLQPDEQATDMFFANNHMWMKAHPDGTCHIGVDKFLVEMLPEIERLNYTTEKGTCLPSAIVTVCGADVELKFPRKLQLKRVNTYLRARPADIVRDPYTLGWMFEGIEPEKGVTRSTEANLIKGSNARKWMVQESLRLTDYVRDNILSGRSREFVTMLDGGIVSKDLLHHLTREEILLLFREFFSLTTTDLQTYTGDPGN